MKLILGSGSPRRKQMLSDLGVAFEVRVPELDETRLRGEPALHFVRRLAREKAEKVAAGLNERTLASDFAVLAADTIVVAGGRKVLGKPANASDAVQMLKMLSGTGHEVITAFHFIGRVATATRSAGSFARTKVFFADRTAEFWKWYVSTGEPMDKAGAYAAQGIGMSFIDKVSGSYSNVVGLPLSHVLKLFEKTFGGDLRELVAKGL